MTGQVKEDLISRLGELGVAVENGRLGFRRYLVSRGEFLQKAQWFHFYDLDGQQRSLDLDPGTLAFTTCQVPWWRISQDHRGSRSPAPTAPDIRLKRLTSMPKPALLYLSAPEQSAVWMYSLTSKAVGDKDACEVRCVHTRPPWGNPRPAGIELGLRAILMSMTPSRLTSASLRELGSIRVLKGAESSLLSADPGRPCLGRVAVLR